MKLHYNCIICDATEIDEGRKAYINDIERQRTDIILMIND